ncbi:MAG: transglycosylase SLT domain-containing protein [Bdellovibrionaceae bacterium]|nr:transglycosylase SLT domain-containing protein [Pseudobdellovibrionaceae bacterium]MBX3032291.1 transglycosylase SLT domain-containing protein [Pseudobdellovibrionaceae bacterium]
MSAQRLLISLSVCFLFTANAISAPAADPLQQARDLQEKIEGGDFLEADAALAKLIEDAKTPEAKEGFLYLQAWGALQAGQYERALKMSEDLLKGKLQLEEDVRALRAQCLEKLGRWNDSLSENRRLLEMSPNFRLRFEANMRMGRAKRAENKTRESRNIFAALEKKARGTPGHPDVMIELARAERKIGSQAAGCQWLKRLYKKHPLHPMLKDWGPDLASNELDGQKTQCRNTTAEFRERVRALMWNGEEEKARREVQEVANLIAKDNRYQADELRAWFLLQTGEPDEAYRLLEASVPRRGGDPEFLTIFASAAARSGNGNAAVGAYHKLYEMNPRKEKGRKALYQSAFLSYQFQDYDGAARRFREFMDKYPRSGLQRDAKWNLAWISYLKKDYEGARRRFAELAGGKKKSSLNERARYWMAMSLLRMGRNEEARPVFEAISQDKSGSYYGTVARQRLQVMPATPKIVPRALPDVLDDGPRAFGPFRSADLMMPSSEGSSRGAVSEEAESEETLANETEDSESTVTADATEDSATDLVQETGRSDILDDPSPIKAPANARRFERARILGRLGFIDEARWELFEIERRTQSRDELKALIAAYEEIGQWHRSSKIAQLRFASARVSQGFDNARPLWESAFPQAFLKDVRSGARNNGLPEEFIWGIMKAESQYRRDAVSPVGALGLMQIMPGTGRKIASLQGEKSFQPPQLLRPEVAIQMGSFYLKRLSKQFNNSIPLAAAAYNAGPHRVHSWLLAFGDLEMDEFVEHIPFLETREYVRRVVSNAFTYSNLYNGRNDLVNLASPVPVKGKAEFAKREVWDP